MVCYCCVKGCTNNSKVKKKNPNSTITFHAFPTNIILKSKWVKAIGRPNWEPPAYARICSSHFDRNCISSDHCRTRIKDDAVPVINLPVNSNFDASNVEICRICLVDDVRLYNTQEGTMKIYLELLMTYMITQDLVRKLNRKELKLHPQLSTSDVFNTDCFQIKYLSNNNSEEKCNKETKHINTSENKIDEITNNDDDSEMIYYENDSDCSEDKLLSMLKKSVKNEDLNEIHSEKKHKVRLICESTVKMSSQNMNEKFASKTNLSTLENQNIGPIYGKTELPFSRVPSDKQFKEIYPTDCEHCSKSVNSRREHWWHTIKEHPAERDSYQRVITAICDTCGKGFQNKTKLHIHELRHSPPSVKCAQCGRAFYDKYALARHARTHTRERPYVCAHCGQTFTLRTNLNRHAKVHSNVASYLCSICGKRFKYTTSRNLHVRTVHYKQSPPPRKKHTKPD